MLRDFQFRGGLKDVVFLKYEGFCKISVSNKTNFARNTNSARLIIFVGLYNFS